MGLREILFRIERAASAQVHRVQYPRLFVPAPDSSQLDRDPLPVPNEAAESIMNRADRVISGRVDIFALRDHELGAEPQWNVDPLTGTTAPLVFGKLLNYRDPALVGNIKYIWEPSRHRHIPCLAQAYRLTNSDRYIQCVERQIGTWISQCPFAYGVHWTSGLEAAIRLINWALAWRIVGGRRHWIDAGASEDFLDAWLKSIYQHLHFIADYYSGYSSANNHLIGEAAGVYIGATTWPFWAKSVDWQARSRAIIIEQITAQVHDDGVGKEQTTAYQQFILDFFVTAGLTSLETDSPFPDNFWQVIAKMLSFLSSISDAGGNVPMIGDADDGFLFDLFGDDGSSNYASLIKTGSALLESTGDVAEASLDSKTRWLLAAFGGNRKPSLRSTTAATLQRASFPTGGYYVMADQPGTQEEIKLVFDAGPLGLRPLAAHGHADALAFTLSVGGHPIIVDPGTFVYGANPAWRSYFRGTSAHNTVRVDSKDQSRVAGDFMWASQANADVHSLEETDDEIRILASHDGYERLADPVTHRRTVRLSRRERFIEIDDELECNGQHGIEIFFHFDALTSVELADPEVRIALESRTLGLTADPRLDKELFRGSEDPQLGWVSYAFDAKEPAYCLRLSGDITGTTNFCTRIDVK